MRFPISTVLAPPLLILLASLSETRADESGTRDALLAAQASGPTRVFLHTEWLPYKKSPKYRIEHLMLRELVRQAFVLAAHHDFGLEIRDASLGETFDDESDVVHLVLIERTSYVRSRATLELQLFKIDRAITVDQISNLWGTAAIWSKNYEFPTATTHLYAYAASLFGDATDDFAEALRLAGVVFPEQQAPINSPPTPTSEWNRRVLSGDYVTQFGIAREVMTTLKDASEKTELFGLLARINANLALFTDHQANAVSRVFAARALLYCTRLPGDTTDDARRLDQFYAWSLVGHHYGAQKILESIDTPLEDFGDSKPWAELLRAYIDHDLLAVEKIAKTEAPVQAIALRLWFELLKGYGNLGWFRDAYERIIERADDSYGVYAGISRHETDLSLSRQAAFFAPLHFNNGLQSGLATMKDLPRALQTDVLDSKKITQDAWQSLWPAGPSEIAAQLRDLNESGTDNCLSWSALAYLIEEEQFILAENFLRVSLNAVESSHDEQVATILDSITEHRYADWIRSYKHAARVEQHKRYEQLKDLRFFDMRGSMSHMWASARWAMFKFNRPLYDSIPQDWVASDLTYQGFIEDSPVRGVGPERSDEHILYYNARFGDYVPKSPIRWRYEILYSDIESVDELAEIEDKLGRDAIGYRHAGAEYWGIYKRTEAEAALTGAIRCLNRSIKLLPDSSTAIRLAKIHWDQGNKQAWESSLQEFLASDVEQTGLQPSVIQAHLAYGLADQGRWKEAHEFALLAASTASGSGFLCASATAEGLEDWDESEDWIQALSTNYPSSSGYRWYFWCRRNERGNVESARRIASAYFRAPTKTGKSEFARGIYCILERRGNEAFEAFQYAAERELPLAAFLAFTFAGNEIQKDEARLEVNRIVESCEQTPESERTLEEKMNLLFADLANKSSLSEADIDAYKKQLPEEASQQRNAYAFLLGRLLQLAGETDQALELYDSIRQPGGFAPGHCETLAGAAVAGAERARRTERPAPSRK
ncbi:MAG: hypothetical protein Aurels2KO_26340 [Aureliella sp.]